MNIHSITTLCSPLARIINKATYSSNGRTALWVGYGRIDDKALAEVKAFVESMKDVWTDGTRYIFNLEGHEFDLNHSRTHVSLIVKGSVR